MVAKAIPRTPSPDTGMVSIRSRKFPETTARPAGIYYAVFIGQHAKGGWMADQLEAKALAAEFEKNVRPCLRCKGPFYSHGSHNRMCDPCRTRDTGIL